MDAKSIYEELLKQGIPEKLVTWSNKADSIDILIQDYNEKVYKEALKFFKGYEGVRVDYTIDHETALWCDDVSKYSSDEFIRSITDFYYTLRAKGLAYTESKKSARKSIEESVPFTKIIWYDDFLSQEMANLIGDKFDVSVSYFSDFDEGVYGIRIKTSDYNSKILNFIKKKVGDVSVLEESKKSLKESHGFDEENEYMLGLSVVTNESLIEDTLEEDGLEVDWDYISKVSSELDYAIERKFAKEIGHVAIEEFHDDDSYNCTFWVRFDDSKANKYMKNLNYFDDYTRGNSTVFMYDVDEILDNEIDKLEKKYDSDILGILRECVTVEIEVPTESVFNESRKSIKEAKDIEIKVYFDGHTTPSNKYQDYNFSPYSKKYEIIGLTESKDDIILTFERGNPKSLTYLGVTVDFDKENNAKCDKWECEIDIDEVQEFIIRFSLRLFK